MGALTLINCPVLTICDGPLVKLRFEAHEPHKRRPVRGINEAIPVLRPFIESMCFELHGLPRRDVDELGFLFAQVPVVEQVIRSGYEPLKTV